MYKKVKRLVIEVSEEFHQEMKMKAVQEKTTIRELMSKIIEKYKQEV